MKNSTPFNKNLNKIIVIFILLCFISTSYLSAQTFRFDRAKWDNSIKYRKKIGRSTDLRKLIIGKTNKEIIDLLGEPEIKHEDLFNYCTDKKVVFIADCMDKNENCYCCNSSALAIILSDGKAFDIYGP